VITFAECTESVIRTVVADANCNLPADLDDMIHSAERAPLKVALMNGDEVLGFIVTEPCPYVPQMGHTWAVIRKAARGHAVSLVRAARKHIRDNFPTQGYDLVYTYCAGHETEQQRWCQALGFERAPQGDHMDQGINWMGYTYHE
jgi:hypothetical protein